MKIRMVFAALILVLIPPMEVEAQVTVTTKAKPQYLGANGAIFYDGYVQHSDVFVAMPKGFYFDAWHSISFVEGSNFGKEVDFTFGKSGELGKLSYDVSAIYLLVQGGNVFSLAQEVGYEIKAGQRSTLKPYLRLDEFWPTRGESVGPGSGILTTVGAVGTYKFNEKVTFSQKAMALFDNGAFGFQPGSFFRTHTQLNVALTERVTLAPALAYSTPISLREDDSRKSEAVLELGLSWRP